MNPFINLEDPVYRNIPDKAETRAFEHDMDYRVRLKEAIGGYYIGQDYFSQKDPDDLAQVFEEKLAESCARWTHVTYEVGEDNPIKMMQASIREQMSTVMRDHLKRTNGNIGHFPYSKERSIMRWVDADKDTYDVRLDPFSICSRWAEASASSVMAAARKNDPRKLELARHSAAESARRRSINYKALFLISTILFVVSLLGTWALKQAGNVWLLLQGYLPYVAAHLKRTKFVSLELVYRCCRALEKAIVSFDFTQDGETFSHRLSWLLRQETVSYTADYRNQKDLFS